MVFWKRKKKKEEVPLVELREKYVYKGEDREGAYELIENLVRTGKAVTFEEIKHRVEDDNTREYLETQLEMKAIVESDRSEDTFRGVIYFLSDNLKLKEGLILEGKVVEGKSVTVTVKTKNQFAGRQDLFKGMVNRDITQLVDFGFKEIISKSGPSQLE
jgi:hypothetical protein